MRKTAHVFGVITLEKRPRFLYQFAPKFNAKTFLEFLKELVRRSRRRKTFLIIDNGPCHNLNETGKQWLRAAIGSNFFACRHTRPSSTRSKASGKSPRR